MTDIGFSMAQEQIRELRADNELLQIDRNRWREMWGETDADNSRLRAEIERLRAGWKEATIAWSVCASIHREYAKGKDPLYKTRQADFVRHENTARRALGPKP